MKKLIYLTAIAAALMAGGCSDDESEVIISIDPEVEVSSSKVLFDADGGSKIVYVGTNCEEWNYDCSASWLTVSRNGDALTLSVAENTKQTKQDADVYITAIMTDVTGQERILRAETQIVVRQLGAPASIADLSAEETSNCYLANTGTDYKFAVTVKGNGKGDGNSHYIETYGLQIENVGYVDLLWEATFDADKTRSTRIIDGAPFCKDGYVYFSTGDIEGNAVIAAFSNAGDILWSWHIWVSNEPVLLSEYNGISWMDRNLGALNNTPADINNRGLFYQWGRKDPFLPSSVNYMNVEASNVLEANVPSYQVGDGSGQWVYTGVKAKLITSAPGNIPNSIQHPTTYLGPYSTFYDWYIPTSGIEDQAKSYLWGDDSIGHKTIFDPCPVGYMVPPSGAFASTLTSVTTSVTLTDQWAKGIDNGRVWTEGNGQFFPYVGLLTMTDTPLTYCGAMATYWTAACIENASGTSAGTSRRLYMNNNYANYTAGGRVYGASVRCVKEQ